MPKKILVLFDYAVSLTFVRLDTVILLVCQVNLYLLNNRLIRYLTEPSSHRSSFAWSRLWQLFKTISFDETVNTIIGARRIIQINLANNSCCIFFFYLRGATFLIFWRLCPINFVSNILNLKTIRTFMLDYFRFLMIWLSGLIFTLNLILFLYSQVFE